tara:strand:- start:2791 stop:3510 length:720 start_codon:yes stop_codon:yes gene_type:complete
MREILRVESLTKTFKDFTAIDNINFIIRNDGIHGLLGTNGAGKTTLMGMILGLIKPTLGKITIFEKNLEFERFEILKHVNFTSPYLDLPKKLTVEENLQFYARLYGVKHIKDTIDKLASDLNIEDLLNKKFGALSAGQKTKIGLCKSLINNPKLLLLDEPTASLDPETSNFLREFLMKFRKQNQMSILIASHNMFEIEKICDTVTILKKGKIIIEGAPKVLIKEYNFKSFEELFLNISI